MERWIETEAPNLNHVRGKPFWALITRCINESGTALHWAAYYGQLDIAKLLIESGASM